MKANGKKNFFLAEKAFLLHSQNAQVAKLVDAPSSGGGAVRCAGSNPVLGTEVDKSKIDSVCPFLFLCNRYFTRSCKLILKQLNGYRFF
jgi:hypothetical protein